MKLLHKKFTDYQIKELKIGKDLIKAKEVPIAWDIFWLRLRKFGKRIRLLPRVLMACFARG